GRTEPHLHLVALPLAPPPVVEQAEADHVIGGVLRIEVVAVTSDDHPDLALEVEVLAARRHRHRVVGADQRVGVREIEDRELEELLGQLQPLRLGDLPDVLAERHEVAHRRRPRDRWQQAHPIDLHDFGRRRERLGAGGSQALAVVAEQIDQLRPRGHRVDLVAPDHADTLRGRGLNLKRRPAHGLSPLAPYFAAPAAWRMVFRYASLPCWSRRPTLLWKYCTPRPRNFGTRLSGQLQPARRPAPVMIFPPRSIMACTSGWACWPV